MLKFVSLSCLLWWLSVPFFSTNGKYKAYSFAWAVELSCIFVMKLKQHCSSHPFSPFFMIFGEFEVFFVPSDPSPYQRTVGKYLGECLAKFIHLQSHNIYVVSIIYDYVISCDVIRCMLVFVLVLYLKCMHVHVCICSVYMSILSSIKPCL